MKNKGITLIALVITIVVLIILAAVAINLSLGNNGIFNRAKTAKEQYQNAQNYEETTISNYSNNMDSYIGTERGMTTISREEIEEMIDNRITEKINSIGATTQKSSGTITAGPGKTNMVCSLNLTKGRYLLLGEVRDRTCSANFVTARFENCDFTTNSSTSAADTYNTNWKDFTVDGFVEVSDGTKKVSLVLDSRNNLSVSGSMLAIKLP